ncbi:TPA: carboxylesterase family protein [Enterobacter hormaechei subsp. steigerwaltii]|nr:carboxylesterase family protein [Enterobacter hormaechei subsp. steigerwaltii]
MEKKRYLNVLFPLILATCSAVSHAAENEIIQTSSGPVEGYSSKGIDSWEGIPFAAAPTGSLRWQPPQPVKPWVKPLKVTSPGSACAQNDVLGVFAKAGGTEDCLYLNVYRDATTTNTQQKRPVFVWIYGGTLQVGQADHYNPEKLVKQGNAIVVTLNYRVGVLGFMANPALNGKDKDYANYGLMDQQAALKWVKSNIADFGGDPENVTIAGESAGGDSVMAHIVSPASAGLFQHAIVLSGATLVTRYPAFGGSVPMDAATNNGTGFAKAAGCKPEDATCLRSLSTDEILKAQNAFALNQVIVDGKIIPKHPADALRDGSFNKVTVINGSVHDEGTLFAALPELATGKTMTEESYPEALKGIVGESLLPTVLKEYPVSNYTTPSEAFAAAAGDSLFSCPARRVNHLLAGKVPLYAYEFSDQTAPLYTGPVSFPLKSAHTSELAYIFPGFHGGADKVVELNPLQNKLSDEMVSYFVNVAAMGGKEKVWPRYDIKKDNYMTFAIPTGRVISGRFNATHHCDFWDKSGIF